MKFEKYHGCGNDFLIVENENLESSEEGSIVVYICGAVKESKVITLKENGRIAFKRNYWICVVVCLIASLLGGIAGGSIDLSAGSNSTININNNTNYRNFIC